MSEIKWNSLTIENPVLPEDGQLCFVEDDFGSRFRAVYRKEKGIFDCAIDEDYKIFPGRILKWVPLKIIKKEDVSND